MSFMDRESEPKVWEEKRRGPCRDWEEGMEWSRRVGWDLVGQEQLV
jgi:hypothetical protein